MAMNRREFLKTTGLAAGMAASGGLLGPLATAQGAPEPPQAAGSQLATRPAALELITVRGPGEKRGEMYYRPLGKTGQMVSLLGLGGWHIGAAPDEKAGTRIIRTAIDRGVTFMDNCWDYHDGKSEVWMGRALQDGYRDKVFLMSKIDGRTRRAAGDQIDESLKRLRTDHLDLMQIHEIIRMEDPDRCFAPDGTIEALTAARKAGKIRFIGFTGHKDPLVHLRMLEVARANDFHFDTVQMPLNVFDAHFRSFAKQVLPVLMDEQIGILGMKPLASGAILKTNSVTATQCLHYAMTLPTSTVITGCESVERLEQGLQAARTFQPMNGAQIVALLEKTRNPALTGQFEAFKTNTPFDGTAHHPEWMG